MGSIKTGNLFEQISDCHYHKDVDSSRWPLSLNCVHVYLLLFWHLVQVNFLAYFSEKHMASTFSFQWLAYVCRRSIQTDSQNGEGEI